MTTVHAKESVEEECIALRAVPVILKNGGRKLVVNAPLDDASTKTYVNSDVAAELGLQGESRKVTVNVLNGQEDTFETPVECGIESLDGRISIRITAFTAKRVTGNMKTVNWARYAKNWTHLKDVNFPYLGPRPIVDILIDIDYADLHYSIKDVRGRLGELVARLTPLGWTCIGHPSLCLELNYRTNFIRTYSVYEDSIVELGNAIRKFWEIEDDGLQAKIKTLKPEDKVALEALKKSIKCEDGRYEVGVPWKEEKPFMPDNYETALRRLQNTEKHFCRYPEIGKCYSDVINQYQAKGCIRKVPEMDKKPSESWYLPHFAVIRPDKETTKTRIVFDASAKSDGISLNDVIHQGPNLQRELFSVLLRFRKNPVALVCDIAEMHLRISLGPEDRPFHRFFWRSLDQTRTPDVYEFNRVVFGVNSSPF
ncbi:uncharacterized protein LOC111343871 [Stylophora pistillata]|nr:uncharacterized protein LOC111343871 [Stylophora pistillata]